MQLPIFYQYIKFNRLLVPFTIQQNNFSTQVIFYPIILSQSIHYHYFPFIMNSNLKTQQPQNLNQVEEETKETKTFIQDVFKIDYLNTSKIFYNNSTSSSDVHVNNYLCYQQGQNLCKVTEIIYEDKLIRIEDKFEVNLSGVDLGSWSSNIHSQNEKDEKKSSRNFQKVRMFNKSMNKESKNEKKDKKNIVKNVVKIFLSWLQKKQGQNDNQHEKEALQKLHVLLETENYNNRLVKKIVESNQIKKIFLKFIQDSAQDQIKYSRIQDKESHYQALQIYKNLLLKSNHQLTNSLEYLSHSNNSIQSQSSSNQSCQIGRHICKSHHLRHQEQGNQIFVNAQRDAKDQGQPKKEKVILINHYSPQHQSQLQKQ